MLTNLKTNLNRALELPQIRKEISLYIEESDIEILVNLGKSLLDADIKKEDVEADLGSELTERLLDTVKCSSWERLHPVYEGINQ